ncbi:hypothetical protein [Leptolyngbya sp. NIES-2104]|uniref:hypothetical protein n=1 Tax=Leptolyngbya sp. NIES-2104 TaxID=1552121 RepID=UPI0006EC984E|nr:hypothetical protein [Leptolyngbya sp. NIES-2104]GAP94586.1 hypothetical protein NIES2104_10970 [Leptolyngbya sp. NIES-2104]
MNYLPEQTTFFAKPSLAKIESVTADEVRISWRATTWNAQLCEPCDRQFAPGEWVWVVGFYNIDLLIMVEGGQR